MARKKRTEVRFFIWIRAKITKTSDGTCEKKRWLRFVTLGLQLKHEFGFLCT
jgi:hypothetical protein